MEYGDSRDRYNLVWTNSSIIDLDISYYVNEDQFTSEKNVARQYAGQKVWPRAVYIRRAR
jgi:proteasome activator subunit 4